MKDFLEEATGYKEKDLIENFSTWEVVKLLRGIEMIDDKDLVKLERCEDSWELREVYSNLLKKLQKVGNKLSDFHGAECFDYERGHLAGHDELQKSKARYESDILTFEIPLVMPMFKEFPRTEEYEELRELWFKQIEIAYNSLDLETSKETLFEEAFVKIKQFSKKHYWKVKNLDIGIALKPLQVMGIVPYGGLGNIALMVSGEETGGEPYTEIKIGNICELNIQK